MKFRFFKDNKDILDKFVVCLGYELGVSIINGELRVIVFFETVNYGRKDTFFAKLFYYIEALRDPLFLESVCLDIFRSANEKSEGNFIMNSMHKKIFQADLENKIKEAIK